MVTYFFHNQVLPGFLSTDDLCLGVLYRIKKDHTSHIVTKSFFFSIHFTGKHSCAPFLFNVSFSTPTFSNKLDEEGDIGGYNNEPSFGNTRGQITHGDCNHNFMVGDQNQPLDKLLVNKRFLHSFMAFADRCAPQFPLVATKPSGHVYNMLVLHLIVVVWLARVCISLKRHMN